MTKGLADADGPQFHLLFFSAWEVLDISSFIIAGFAVIDEYLQSHIVIPNNHVDIDIDIDVVCC